MKKNIYLVGFMGAGKSTIGKQLAKETGRKFIDTDREIEKKFSMSINAIFEKEGEAFFRAEEKKLAFSIAEKSNMIVSAGGGTINDDEIFEKFRSSGIMICLYAGKSELISRLKRTNKRPVLKGGNIEDKVSSLLEERNRIFRKIPIRIDTTDKTPREVVKKLIDLFKIRESVLFKIQGQEIDIS